MKLIMQKIFFVFLCIALMPMTVANAKGNEVTNSTINKKELTDDLLLEMKENMKSMNPIQSAIYFEEMMEKHTLNYTKIIPSDSSNQRLMNSVGDSRYTLSYSNSGIYNASSTTGKFLTIANTSISLVLGLTTYVGSILYGVVNLLVSFIPDVDKQAQAKNMYSYRYITYNGDIYMAAFPSGYHWVTHAISTSRQVYEHGWGYFIDSNGFARQSTIDFPNAKHTQWAAHSSPSAIQAEAIYWYNNGTILIPKLYSW